MTDSQIIALFWERNEDAIQETDEVYGRNNGCTRQAANPQHIA